MNKRKGLIMWNMRITKTQSKELSNAISDDDYNLAEQIFRDCFNKCEVELR